MKRFTVLFFLIGCLMTANARISLPSVFPDNMVLQEHPRLFLKQGEETRIAEAVGKFPAVARMHGIVMDWADSALSLNPVTRKMEGIRLLETSRESLKRVFALSYAWRMTGNPAYAERAEREMLACCSFEDWNPSHFLDVAEMSLSMAIGYDWLYDVLSLQTIEKIRDAVFEKAFVPVETSSQPWYGYSSNWNSVCNAGLTAAAVAFYEDAPKRCSSIVSRAIESNPKVMASYAPDGGYPEGYMYWAYGTAFEILLIDALEGVCGTDFGLSEYPGFMESGRFVQAMLTPSGGCFNFSDASYGSASNPMLFWMARRTGDLSLLYSELEYIGTASTPVFREERLLPFAIICASTLDLDRVSPPDWNTWSNGGETPVFTYRSGWESPYDTYFGIKGGTPVTGHSHLDGGSFIYEKDSIRWALDLGMQNYYSLEKYGLGIWSTSQGSDRWKVFRYTDRSHNTVSVPGCLHRVGGRAEIVDTFSSASRKGAEVDMTSLLPQFRKVSRTAFLDADDNLHMEDLFVAGDSSHTVVWMMNTEAEPEILSDDEIRLSCRNREMTVRFRATSPFRLGIFPNDPPEEYDAPNPGTVRIGLTMEVGPGDTAVINADFRYLGEMVPQIIFDTDMGNDIDDALALAMLYKYNDDGKIGLKAVMLNKEGPAAPEFMDIMGTWYGYPDIPVGVIRDGAECGGDAESYTRKVMEMKTPEGKPLFGRTHSDYGDYPESVTLYRKLLSEAADSSLTIVSVGFFTNLARLLESGPDSFSELSGRELVGRKVRNLVAMAGCISDTTNYEYNVVLDIPSAKKVLTEWPVDVILSPFELGLQVCYPASSIENDFEWTEHHPVEEAYRFFMKMPYDRPSWDMTAVLAAVENSPEYFTVSPAGTISVSDNGSTVFSEGNGNRYYLSVTPEQAENIKDRIISLVTAVPLSFGR